MHYTVTLTFQFPAWDEQDGLEFEVWNAESKSDAIKQIRSVARDEGHTCSRGRYWFSATLSTNTIQDDDDYVEEHIPDQDAETYQRDHAAEAAGY
jgi:hypothetical protein